MASKIKTCSVAWPSIKEETETAIHPEKSIRTQTFTPSPPPPAPLTIPLEQQPQHSPQRRRRRRRSNMVRPSVRFRPSFGLRSSFSRFRCLSNGLSRRRAPMGKGAPCCPAAWRRRKRRRRRTGCDDDGDNALPPSSFLPSFERKCPNNEVGRKEISPACLPCFSCTHTVAAASLLLRSQSLSYRG